MRTTVGQHVVDILLQETGSIENMHSFLRLNGVSAEQHFSGQAGNVPDVDDGEVVQYYRDRGIVVATGEHNELAYPGGSYSDDWSNDYD